MLFKSREPREVILNKPVELLLEDVRNCLETSARGCPPEVHKLFNELLFDFVRNVER